MSGIVQIVIGNIAYVTGVSSLPPIFLATAVTGASALKLAQAVRSLVQPAAAAAAAAAPLPAAPVPVPVAIPFMPGNGKRLRRLPDDDPPIPCPLNAQVDRKRKIRKPNRISSSDTEEESRNHSLRTSQARSPAPVATNSPQNKYTVSHSPRDSADSSASSPWTCQDEITCPCGTTFPGHAAFCIKCGKPRPVVCACGVSWVGDAMFCEKCGQRRSDLQASNREDMPARKQEWAVQRYGHAASSSKDLKRKAPQDAVAEVKKKRKGDAGAKSEEQLLAEDDAKLAKRRRDHAEKEAPKRKAKTRRIAEIRAARLALEG